MTDKEKLLVKQYREDNKSYKEIADILGMTKSRVKCYCNRNSLNGFRARVYDLKEQEQIYKERFEKNQPNFKYISGYASGYARGVENTIKCECKVCGHMQYRNTQIGNMSNTNTQIRCDNCIKIKQRERDIKRNNEREQLRLRKFEISKDLEQLKLSKYRYITCKECGKEFRTNISNATLCSHECRRKYRNRSREISRRHKLRENGKIDWDITLTKLIKRDKGTCHICGRKVNTKVNSNHDEYGSIDHVIPVSKGGTHTWDNVKLAHRQCNTIKRDNMIYVGANSQVTMALS